MAIPDDDHDLDLTLRDVSRRFPEHLARALLPPGTVITEARVTETQLAQRQRRMDRGLEVVANGERRIEHTEWMIEMEADTPFRIFEYHALSSIALAAEAPPGKKPLRIRSTLVLLSGREKPWPEEGEYRTAPDDASFSGVTFRIDAVYQRTVAELAARGSPLWMIFAPLAVDADPQRMAEVLAGLRAETSKEEFRELAAAATVMAVKDKRRRGLGEVILELAKEDVMQSSVFQLGRQEGEKLGKLEGQRDDFTRLFGKRLGRALTGEERTTLLQRLGTLGADRLDDVLFGLSPDALAAWLGDPSAA